MTRKSTPAEPITSAEKRSAIVMLLPKTTSPAFSDRFIRLSRTSLPRLSHWLEAEHTNDGMRTVRSAGRLGEGAHITPGGG